SVVDCFFFQAEDGIRDRNVTGVQTCALPISNKWPWTSAHIRSGTALVRMSIGRFGDDPAGRPTATDEEIIDRAFADWRAITSRPSARILAADVQRWDSALPQYTPGHGSRIAAVDASIAAVDGLE